MGRRKRSDSKRRQNNPNYRKVRDRTGKKTKNWENVKVKK